MSVTTEHGQRDAADLRSYLAAMSKAVFQSGMGRSVVEAKWEGIEDAFHGFDPEFVAGLTESDVDRLCADPHVIRNRRKIEATIHNAQRLIDLDAEVGFADWLDHDGAAPDVETALRREFKYLGPSGIHEFLHLVGAADGAACAGATR